MFNSCRVDIAPPALDPCTSSESLDSIFITESEVHFLLRNLIEYKATGPDGIPSCLLKCCSEVIAPSLAALFEISIESGIVPSEWKLANVRVAPVLKKGDSHEVIINYRPISLPSLVSKVLECVIFTQVVNRSCGTQPLQVLHDVGSALDTGRKIDLIYLDFAKAFDCSSQQTYW